MLVQAEVIYETDSGLTAMTFPFATAKPKDSLLIQKITGLNPPPLNLYIGEYASDGGIYQGRGVGTRNPVFTMKINPNDALGETVSGLREILYQAFLSPIQGNDGVQVNLIDDLGRTRFFVGYTETIDGEIFDVDTTVQISMICANPYLQDLNPTTMSDPSGWSVVPPFAYGGTAPTGFSVEIHVDAATSYLVLDLNGNVMGLSYDFAEGDIININTVVGSRAITLTPAAGGDPISILAALSSSSPWLFLQPNTSNTLKVYGPGGSADVRASIRNLTFQTSYWGV